MLFFSPSLSLSHAIYWEFGEDIKGTSTRSSILRFLCHVLLFFCPLPLLRLKSWSTHKPDSLVLSMKLMILLYSAVVAFNKIKQHIVDKQRDATLGKVFYWQLLSTHSCTIDVIDAIWLDSNESPRITMHLLNITIISPIHYKSLLLLNFTLASRHAKKMCNVRSQTHQKSRLDRI